MPPSESRRARDNIFRFGWKFPVFVLIALLTAALGLTFHIEAHAVSQDAELAKNPLKLGVLVSDPTAITSVRLNLLSYQGYSVATLRVGTNKPTEIEVDSNVRPTADAKFGRVGSSHDAPRSFTAPEWSLVLSPAQHASYAQMGDPEVAEFRLPADVFKASRSALAIQMPSISEAEDNFIGEPLSATAINAEDSATPWDDVRLKPGYQQGDTNSGHYHFLRSADKVGTLFWPPNQFSAVEVAYNTGPITNYQLDSVSPSDGYSASDNFFWRGSYGLEGSVVATNPSLVQAESNDEFFSGIAFAMAVSIAIAAAQELPLHRRTKPNNQAPSSPAPRSNLQSTRVRRAWRTSKRHP